jgi:hypothetical protein
MAQVITEGTTTERAKAQARSLERGHNRPLGDGVYPMQQPEFFVYLYSVAKKEMRTEHALLGPVEVFPLEEGQRYRRIGIPIPEPFPQRVEDVFNVGRDPYDYHRGNAGARRIAQDVCDPSNPTLNQKIEDYGKIDPYFAVQNGTNFAKHGVFWSLNAEPTEEELTFFEARRDKFLRHVINLFDKFQAEDPKNAERLMGNAGFDSRDVRIALSTFGEERPGYKSYAPMSQCPNCGENIKKGVAFHKDSDGDLCVIDWRRTVEAGKKKREDVPPEKKWWAGPGRPPKESPETEA